CSSRPATRAAIAPARERACAARLWNEEAQMTTDQVPLGATAPAGRDPRAPLEERLERGEVIFYAACPFPLPGGADREFLFRQGLGSRAHKNVSYDPATGKAAGFRRESPEQAERLRRLLAEFAEGATSWLAQ